jgi:hypothetical protein
MKVLLSMLRSLFLALLLSLSSVAATGAAAPGAPPVQKLVYKVNHSRYGNLGTFTNTIAKAGDKTTVTSDAHYRVAVLGVTFYRQDVSRVETWSGERLVNFHGVTSDNGKDIELTGWAEGDHFIMKTPEGTVTAPANIRLANPWSRTSVEGGDMLTPDRGRLEHVTLTDMDDADIRIGSRMVHTKHFAVVRGGGPRKYEIWLDETDTPVQFALVTPANTITFTLTG